MARAYQNTTIRIRVPSGNGEGAELGEPRANMTIKKVLGSYPSTVDDDKKSAVVLFGDVWFGEKRDVLIEVIVEPRGSEEGNKEMEEAGHEIKILEANCGYYDITSKTNVSELPSPVPLVVTLATITPTTPRYLNPMIQKQRWRLRTAETIAKAAQHARDYQYTQGQDLFTEAITGLEETIEQQKMNPDGLIEADESYFKALLADLKVQKEALRDRRSSSTGGIQSAMNTSRTHHTQRTTYSMTSSASETYQTPYSLGYETASRQSSRQNTR